MTTPDFAAIAKELELIGLERTRAIEQMRANARWPAVDVDKRASRIPTLRQAVIVARALADSPDAQAIVIARVGGSNA
jgi:hypothetical protein